MTNIQKSICCTALSLILLIPNFIHYNIIEAPGPSTIHEKFDPSLSRLQTLRSLTAYTDSLAAAKKIIPGTIEYALMANDVVSNRFYHNYATKDISNNWIAAISEKITGLCLSTSFTADDILKKPYGYCVQVNTVLIALLQQKQYSYKIVAFPHHFATMFLVENNWYFFDADQDPQITPQNRSNSLWLHNADSMKIAYHKTAEDIGYSFGFPIHYDISKENTVIAPHAKLFQFITAIFSKIAFIFPLIWFVYLKSKNSKQIAVTPTQQTTQQPYHYFHSDERAGFRA